MDVCFGGVLHGASHSYHSMLLHLTCTDCGEQVQYSATRVAWVQLKMVVGERLGEPHGSSCAFKSRGSIAHSLVRTGESRRQNAPRCPEKLRACHGNDHAVLDLNRDVRHGPRPAQVSVDTLVPLMASRGVEMILGILGIIRTGSGSVLRIPKYTFFVPLAALDLGSNNANAVKASIRPSALRTLGNRKMRLCPIGPALARRSA